MNEYKKHEALWTLAFIGMSLGNTLIYTTQYAMIAALPIIIMTMYGGGDVEAGLAMTFFQIGTIVTRPFAGILIDAVNKRQLILGITTAFFLVMTAFAFASALSMLYGLRLVHGIIFALATTTAAAIAALILPPARKGEGIGYFALSTNLAMVAGPMIGLLILEYFSPTVLFAALSVLAAISIAAGGAHRLPDEIILPVKTQRTLSVSTFIERRALAPALIAGILFFAYGSVLTFIPLYTRSLGLSAETSLFYACYAGAILVTRPFVGRIFDRKGSDYTVYPGLVLFAAGMFLLGNIEGLSGLIAAAVLLGMNDLFEKGLDEAALAELAAEIGSDVPFCLAGGTQLALPRRGSQEVCLLRPLGTLGEDLLMQVGQPDSASDAAGDRVVAYSTATGRPVWEVRGTYTGVVAAPGQPSQVRLLVTQGGSYGDLVVYTVLRR